MLVCFQQFYEVAFQVVSPLESLTPPTPMQGILWASDLQHFKLSIQ